MAGKQIHYDNKYVKKWSRHLCAVTILGGKCIKCGEDHIATLDFHHVNPSEKETEVVKLLRFSDWDLIESELCKCVLLCANCHRKTHFDDKRFEKFKDRIESNACGKPITKEQKCRRWGEDEVESLIIHYNKGIPINYIAELMSRTAGVIKRKILSLQSQGVLTQRDKVLAKRPKRCIEKETISKIIELHNSFVPASEISHITGVSFTKVYRILSDYRNEEKENGERKFV